MPQIEKSIAKIAIKSKKLLRLLKCFEWDEIYIVEIGFNYLLI